MLSSSQKKENIKDENERNKKQPLWSWIIASYVIYNPETRNKGIRKGKKSKDMKNCIYLFSRRISLSRELKLK